MKQLNDIHLRDPFVLPLRDKNEYYLFGTTDEDPWKTGVGFDAYVSRDLSSWEGPFEAFRPAPGFWATKNFWAPEAHEFRGGFYLFASFKADGRCRGTQILNAEGPKGPYRPISDGPVTPMEWECLDGTLYVDAKGDPWIVFCHEWVQIADGTVCCMRLSDDLRKAVTEPVTLFAASSAPWVSPLDRVVNGNRGYVTDGPFLHTRKDGTLLLLWSSFTSRGYAMGIARSESGSVLGPWIHDPEPLMDRDSGHGMAFRAFDGSLYATVHSPNKTPLERPVFVRIEETGRTLSAV